MWDGRTCKSVVFCALYLCTLLLIGRVPVWAWVQIQEPSPIEIELVVPTEVAPETAFDIVIKYDTTDLNAGADIHYNLFGPARIISRDPSPPDPAHNTWVPRRDSPKGTIKVHLIADQATEGQAIQHQVQVRWGSKERVYQAETEIRHPPPTPTPTSTPRPSASETPAAAPSSAPTGSIPPSLELKRVFFTSVGGKVIDEAQANQEIGVQILYVSTAELMNVEVAVRFDPDLVNLEGWERVDGAYVLALDTIPAAPSEAHPLLDKAVTGRIRPDLGRGDRYQLRAGVELRPSLVGVAKPSLSLESAALTVTQPLLAVVKADLDAQTIRAGGSIVVHAVLQNAGQLAVTNARLSIRGLPEGFSVNPRQQWIATVAPRGGVEERLFTIHAADDFEGPGSFRVLASVGEATMESQPVNVQVVRPVPLTLEVLSTQSSAYAGEPVQLIVRCTNNSQLVASSVRARLIDRSGSLDAQFQDMGDIGAGESRDLAFVVQVPRDVPANANLSLVVQAISSDGSIGATDPTSLVVSCVPQLEVSVRPISSRLGSGQSAEAIVVLRNVSPCPADQVLVSIEGLPEAFAQPAEQLVFGLGAGTTRHMAFNVLIPHGFRGLGSFVIAVTDSAGNQLYSEPESFSVSGVSAAFIIAFGALALLAVSAVVFGVVFYLRPPG